ncbi:MAG: DMT family transporter [Thaumarchaeota archaeon]|nr:DMT family transporter [Nitrososphaerota archaeon]
MADTFALAVTFALVNSVLFGFSKILYRKGVMHMPVQIAILYTLLPAVPILLAATVITGEYAWLKITPFTLILIPLTGMFNFNLGRLFLFETIRSLGASRASQLIATQLIFTSIFGVVFKGETMTIYVAVGTIIIFAAISFLLFSPMDLRLKPLGYNLRRGLIMGIVGSVIWAFGFLVSKLMVDEYPPLSASFLTVAAAAVTQTVMALPSFRSAGTVVPDRRSMGYFLASGVVTTAAFLAFMLALSLSPIVVIAPFASLSPIFAAIWSYFFIQRMEFIGVRIILASILVAVGSYIISL